MDFGESNGRIGVRIFIPDGGTGIVVCLGGWERGCRGREEDAIFAEVGEEGGREGDYFGSQGRGPVTDYVSQTKLLTELWGYGSFVLGVPVII